MIRDAHLYIPENGTSVNITNFELRGQICSKHNLGTGEK